MVRTDHYILKYLLEQRLSTIPQHYLVNKLLGYDFRMEFKPVRQNIAAHALSRRDSDTSTLLALCMPNFTIFDDLRHEAAGNDYDLATLHA